MSANDQPEKLRDEEPHRREIERYTPNALLRLALLALIYLSAKFLDSDPGPGRDFDIIVCSTVVYTGLLALASGRLRLGPAYVLGIDLAIVVWLCQLTGGIESVVKYFGLAYFYMMSPYICKAAMKAVLLVYSCFVTLLVLAAVRGPGMPASSEMVKLTLINLFVLNGAGWPAVVLSEYIEKLKELQRSTSLAFHSLNNALHLRTQNLQAALEALTQAHSRLKTSHDMKSTLLSNVSHEIRTPLASVRSYSEILLNYDDLDRDTQKEFLGIILEESKRLNFLVNDVLDVLKLDSGKFELQAARVDMAEVMAMAVKAQEPFAREKGIDISFDHPDGSPLYVIGNKYQLTQVLVNLVNNAVKFTSRGGVSISATPGQEMLEVRVADTGEGIYPEETDSIFEEFFRTADSPEGRPQGSGLGLSITRKIVELHGGTVKVDSEIGKGSVFSFTVPLDVEKLMVETDNAPAAYHGVYTSGDEGISGHRLIMVVEQNSAIRQLMRKRLESMGYTTLGAGSGKAAFDLCVDRSPDLVLSTILSYPDTDINLHKRLRASAKTSCIPIILTSIAIGPSSSLTAAANGYISRPLDRFDLITEAGKLLSHGRGPVLIISSYQHEARSAQVILSNEGYKVMVADAASGTDPIKSESPKLVILDGSLPSGGTLDILTALRCDEETRSIPVMLITDLPLPDKHVTLVTENRKRPKPGEDGLVTLINEVRQILGRSGRGICR